jgi:hypothetical protein
LWCKTSGWKIGRTADEDAGYGNVSIPLSDIEALAVGPNSYEGIVSNGLRFAFWEQRRCDLLPLLKRLVTHSKAPRISLHCPALNGVE